MARVDHHVEASGGIDGELIRRMREEMGYSRARFAAKIGCHVHSVENWEYGKCHPSGAARKMIVQIHKRWKRQRGGE